MTIAVDFKNVDIVFGADKARSLAMIDAGATRAQVLEQTGNVVGCAGANLTVQEGEISVLMGLSGSGKSTLLRAVNRLNLVSRGQVLVRDGDRMVDVVKCDDATLRKLRRREYVTALVMPEKPGLATDCLREASAADRASKRLSP